MVDIKIYTIFPLTTVNLLQICESAHFQFFTCNSSRESYVISLPYQYNHIHTTLHQQVQTVLVIIVGADSSTTQ